MRLRGYPRTERERKRERKRERETEREREREREGAFYEHNCFLFRHRHFVARSSLTMFTERVHYDGISSQVYVYLQCSIKHDSQIKLIADDVGISVM